MEKEIFVENLEANVTRIVASLEETSKKISSDNAEEISKVIAQLKEIKIEPADFTSITEAIKTVVNSLKALEEKEIDTGYKEICTELCLIKDAVNAIEKPEFDTTVIESLLAVLNDSIVSLSNLDREVKFPDVYPLPEDQVNRLTPEQDKILHDKIDTVNKLLEEIRDLSGNNGGGGGPDVVGLKNIVNGRETRISIATDDTLQSVAKFNIPKFDYIAATYPDTDTEVYTYKTGGVGGTTVGVITINYTDSTKDYILNVSKA